MRVSGSILTDLMKTKDAVKLYDKSNIDYIHIDFMDGKFVPNKSFTVSEVIGYSKYTTKPFDIHLMVSNPLKYIDDFSVINAHYITFHYEAVKNHLEVINHIKDNGIKAGISINPDTDVKSIFPLLKDLDLVLIMSVVPGKSGQSFMESVLSKISLLRQEIDDKGYNTIISVDGGINDTNVNLVKEHGASMVVSSSYFLSGDTLNKINYFKSL